MLYSYLLPKLRRMQYLAVNLATASARTMKARNSLFCMMLCSAATLHLAVDAKISASNRVALPVPSGKTTTVQGRQRPQFKAPPENGGMLTEASASAPVAAQSPAMASSPRRPSHHGETACLQVGPLQFPRPRLKAVQHNGEKAPRRDSNPRPSHCAVDDINTKLLETRDSSGPTPVDSTLYWLSLTAECASRAGRATMPTTTCCQRPTPTPTSRRPAARVARTRSPLGLARRHVTRPTTIT